MQAILMSEKNRNQVSVSLLFGELMSVGSPWSGEE